jgi:hypothetical protein
MTWRFFWNDFFCYFGISQSPDCFSAIQKSGSRGQAHFEMTFLGSHFEWEVLNLKLSLLQELIFYLDFIVLRIKRREISWIKARVFNGVWTLLLRDFSIAGLLLPIQKSGSRWQAHFEMTPGIIWWFDDLMLWWMVWSVLCLEFPVCIFYLRGGKTIPYIAPGFRQGIKDKVLKRL